ncbi:MAG TPA: hypothetical protein VNW04_16360, partial [Puia sp.]|nr:hypothetical protein [Puia sp.]
MAITTPAATGPVPKISLQKKVLVLVGLLLALLAGPYLAVYWQYGGIPDRFFNFPATSPGNPKPGPTLFMTIGIIIV